MVSLLNRALLKFQLLVAVLDQKAWFPQQFLESSESLGRQPQPEPQQTEPEYWQSFHGVVETPRFVSIVINDYVISRSAIATKTTAYNPLIETFQPP